MTNCWIHGTSAETSAEEKKKVKLKERPIVSKSDYNNNLAIILAPTKEQKDQEKLEADIESWKAVFEAEEAKNKDLEEELTQKNDRIAQLDQLFKGSALILQKQVNNIDKIKNHLETEKNKSGAIKEFVEHLKENIGRLGSEKSELEAKISELGKESTQNQTIRDRELADLKREKKDLLIEIENKNLSLNEILANFSFLINRIDEVYQEQFPGFSHNPSYYNVQFIKIVKKLEKSANYFAAYLLFV